MDPFDPNALGPDGLPLQPPPQQPKPQPPPNGSSETSDIAFDAGTEGVELVADEVGLISGAIDVAGSVVSGAAEVVGSVASGAADVVSSVASGAADVVGAAAEGIGPVVEGAASAGDGCASCSVAFALLFLAAGTAAAALLR